MFQTLCFGGGVTIMQSRTELSDDSCDKYHWSESTCSYKHRYQELTSQRRLPWEKKKIIELRVNTIKEVVGRAFWVEGKKKEKKKSTIGGICHR